MCQQLSIFIPSTAIMQTFIFLFRGLHPMSSQRRRKPFNIFEQKIHPLEKILDEKRMPILFVGAGISNRYAGTCTWTDLLESIAAKIGIDRFQLNGIKKSLESEYPDANIYPHLASKLSSMMIKQIGSKQLTRDDFPDMSDGEWAMMEDCDPFKVLICSMLKANCLTDNKAKLRELESFRKLSDKVPAVITTNYDNFLETEVFTDFKTLLYPDDYYFSGSDGYGEILKIHGTIDIPDSIVITAEDYSRLNANSKIILSRLTYLMCYHPIIFVGYSLSDEEIHGLIYDLVSSLKQTDIDRIKNRLILVSVSESLPKSVWNPKAIEFNNKRIEVMNLTVPTFEVLFNYLDKITPVATPQEIRKYKSMIRNIVLSTDPTSKKIVLINEDSLDDMTDNAVMFGNADSINSIMKGITGYEISDAVLDVLSNRKGLLGSSKAVFMHWISQNRICNGDKYVPLFYYCLRYNIDYKTLGDNVVKFTDDMVRKIEVKLNNMAERCGGITNRDDIDSFLDSQVKSFSRPEALMYFQHVGLIDREECRERLEKIYNHSKLEGMCKIKSDLRCAISFLDMDNYLEKGRAEPRTLSH